MFVCICLILAFVCVLSMPLCVSLLSLHLPLSVFLLFVVTGRVQEALVLLDEDVGDDDWRDGLH